MGSRNKPDDRRVQGRITMKLRVSLVMSGEDEIYAVTRDISEKGIFLLLESGRMPDIGQRVNVQVQGLPGEQPPWVTMEVVRTEPDGVGLRLVD